MSNPVQSAAQDPSPEVPTVEPDLSPVPAAAAPGWDWRWTFPLLLAGLVVLAFWPSFSADWVNWDDDRNFTQNRAWRGLGLSNVAWMFSSFHMAHWHPLTWLTLGLDYELYGIEDPGGFHVTNVVLHAATAVAAFFAARRLFSIVCRDTSELALYLAAFFGAALFAIHPLRVESVTWITERRDVLSGLFFFLCLGSWLRYVQAEDAAGKKRAWIWSVVWFLLGGMSKVAVFPLPLVFLLFDLWPLKRLRTLGLGKVLVEKLPFFVLMVGMMVVGMYGQRLQGAMYSFDEHPLAPRLVHVGFSHFFYLVKSFKPTNLSPMYEMPPDDALMAPPWLIQSLIGAGMTVVLLFLYRPLPAVSVAIGWFTILALPISGLSQAGGQIAADRYSYLSCVSLAFLVGSVPLLLARRGKPLLIGSALLAPIVLLLAWMTWNQTQVWKDSKSLWEHVISVQPGNTYAMNSLGQLKAIDSKFETDPAKKKQLVFEAIALHDLAYQTRGDPNHLLNVAGAVRDMADADPEHFDEHLDRAIGTMEEAFKEAEKRGTKIRPHWYRQQGMLYVDKGRFEEGIRALETWTASDPDDMEGQWVLGEAYSQVKRFQDAVRVLEHVIAVEPDFHKAWASMADLQARVGQLEVSRQCWSKVLEITTRYNIPDDDFAKLAREMLPRIEEALRRRGATAPPAQGGTPSSSGQPPPEPR